MLERSHRSQLRHIECVHRPLLRSQHDGDDPGLVLTVGAVVQCDQWLSYTVGACLLVHWLCVSVVRVGWMVDLDVVVFVLSLLKHSTPFFRFPLVVYCSLYNYFHFISIYAWNRVIIRR